MVNSYYDKLEKIAATTREIAKKEENGFATPTEKETLYKKLENYKAQADKAKTKVAGIEKRAAENPKSPLADMVKRIKQDRAEQAKKQPEPKIQPKKDGGKKPKGKPKLLADELNNLDRKERKLVTIVYDVITANLIDEEAKALIEKIQQRLKEK